MLYGWEAPVITHTAATPQDSPSATDTGRAGLPTITLLAGSTLSIDSIDRSVVRTSGSISKLATTDDTLTAVTPS